MEDCPADTCSTSFNFSGRMSDILLVVICCSGVDSSNYSPVPVGLFENIDLSYTAAKY